MVYVGMSSLYLVQAMLYCGLGRPYEGQEIVYGERQAMLESGMLYLGMNRPYVEREMLYWELSGTY